MGIAPQEPPPDDFDESPEYAPLVYAVVGIGLSICLTMLLLARGSFGLVTAALSLALVAPFLLYARLALARPGVEAVIGGVLVLAVGIWGSFTAFGDDPAGPFLGLSIGLVVLELAVFAAGAALRAIVPARPREGDTDQRVR